MGFAAPIPAEELAAPNTPVRSSKFGQQHAAAKSKIAECPEGRWRRHA
ncbi:MULTISPECIES: hypothetical protein [Sphingobium]|jgi:hypothetical protein|uniref:Uncharacterized protein n=1 Tax=Sphingobium subterraneum TaxID=627688 RepID=A0A841J695_9SPHN|nr:MULTISPECIES: hypothetical protein [Sphingobium]MBB6125872.1 hypothetical protein [Sphingobium subterraneum]QWT16864.1 hypothetical protein GTV57_20945 [Sphingobium xenophagum]